MKNAFDVWGFMLAICRCRVRKDYLRQLKNKNTLQLFYHDFFFSTMTFSFEELTLFSNGYFEAATTEGKRKCCLCRKAFFFSFLFFSYLNSFTTLICVQPLDQWRHYKKYFPNDLKIVFVAICSKIYILFDL